MKKWPFVVKEDRDPFFKGFFAGLLMAIAVIGGTIIGAIKEGLGKRWC